MNVPQVAAEALVIAIRLLSSLGLPGTFLAEKRTYGSGFTSVKCCAEKGVRVPRNDLTPFNTHSDHAGWQYERVHQIYRVSVLQSASLDKVITPLIRPT